MRRVSASLPVFLFTALCVAFPVLLAVPSGAFGALAEGAAGETSEAVESPDAHESFLRARAAERAGDARTALSWYGRAFGQDPHSRDLCFLYLERLRDAGAVDSAVTVGRVCTELAGSPKKLSFAEHKLLGEVALRAEDSPAALRHYLEADELKGDDGAVLYILAGLHEEARDWEAFSADMQRLLPLFDYPPRLMERLARAYALQNQPDSMVPILRAAWERTDVVAYGQALAAWYDTRGLNLSLLDVARRLESLEPAPEHAWLLARAYAVTGRSDSARILCARLLREKDADYPGVRFLYASLLFEDGHYKDAEREAGILAKEYPEAPAHHYLEGMAALELRKHRRALPALERALAAAPLSPEYRAGLAYADYALGNPGGAGARLAYAPGDSVDPEQALLLAGLAQGRLARLLEPRDAWERSAVFSDSAAARRHRLLALERFENILSRNSGHRAVLFEAGALLERLGDLAGARKLLRRLVERDTTHALAMNYLGYMLVEGDSVTPVELEESGRLLERAVALDPENAAFLDSKGWWHYRNQAPDSAHIWLAKAAEGAFEDPSVLEHLLIVLHALDQRGEACAVRDRLLRLDPARNIYLHCPAGVP